MVYAGIDTDKHKYPIGSGRVTFESSYSYMKAVAASFVEIKCQKFCKKVQVGDVHQNSDEELLYYRWIPIWRMHCVRLASSDKGPISAGGIHCFQLSLKNLSIHINLLYNVSNY